MALNITLNNPGSFPNINFGGGGPVETINYFFYDAIADTLKAYQIVENSGLSEQMNVYANGVVKIKGVKVTDSGMTKRFDLLRNGNLVAKSFTTTI